MAIAESLKRFRGQFGLSQKAVAEKIGITQPAYSQYEFNYHKDKPKTPSADVVIKLSKAFNVSSDYLLGLTDDPTPPQRTKEIKPADAPPNNDSDNNSELVALRSELARIKSALADNGIKI